MFVPFVPFCGNALGVSAAFFRGLITKRQRWGLSWRGWLVAAITVLLAGWVVIVNIHPFLAVTKRVPTKLLVVEGWTDHYGVAAAVHEFKTGHYDRVLTTGGPCAGYGSSSSIYDTEAWQSADKLKQAGLPEAVVQAVPSCFVGRDRTYNSAVTLRNWLREHGPGQGSQWGGGSFNVLTEDAHARRTWLLFREALGPDFQLGIISVPDPDYDATHWWRYSAGVREVIDESVAYVYAKVFFWPGSPTKN